MRIILRRPMKIFLRRLASLKKYKKRERRVFSMTLDRTPCPKPRQVPLCLHVDPEGKAYGGCSRCRTLISHRICRPVYGTALDNLNVEENPDISIGNCAWRSARKVLWPQSSDFMEPLATQSLQGVTQLESMSIKSTPESKVHNLNLESSPTEKMSLLTGMKSEALPLPGDILQFPVTYLFGVTMPSEESARTIYNHLVWSELYMYSGVGLVLESREELGEKQDWTLSLKIRCLSSGMVTMVTNMLSSMNLEGVSLSLISYGGSIAIQSLWKSKDPLLCCEPRPFGLPRI